MNERIKSVLIKANIIRKTVRSYFTNRSLVVTFFHKMYYRQGEKTLWHTSWLGTKVLKCPLDLWVYQEILYETKPDVIIECGTKVGGSASYLASLCDLLGTGRIITIDVKDLPGKPTHPRVQYLLGSSTSEEIINKVKSLIKPGERVMVILDSNHRARHVIQELELYHSLVTEGNYLIVEDTNINGHPVYTNYGPGPMEAVRKFLKNNKDFIVDRDREKYYLTYNPGGYLKKISHPSL